MKFVNETATFDPVRTTFNWTCSLSTCTKKMVLNLKTSIFHEICHKIFKFSWLTEKSWPAPLMYQFDSQKEVSF